VLVAVVLGTFYAACLFFVFVVLATLARLHGFSLWKVLRYFREELIVVLGTSSTEPVLPRMLLKLEQLGCKKSVSGLVLPMGYSFNLDGTAIYLTLASAFIASWYRSGRVHATGTSCGVNWTVDSSGRPPLLRSSRKPACAPLNSRAGRPEAATSFQSAHTTCARTGKVPVRGAGSGPRCG